MVEPEIKPTLPSESIVISLRYDINIHMAGSSVLSAISRYISALSFSKATILLYSRLLVLNRSLSLCLISI